MLLLGKVMEGLDRLSEDFSEEKRSAANSRASIHQRLDTQVERIGRLETASEINVQINAQQREALKALNSTVQNNHMAVQPSIDEWRRMKALGIGLAGLLALGGLSLGAMLMWASDAAVTAVRHWLRISG